jgi:hypothetical protein
MGESVRLGTERRPMNLIMGVCLRRTLVARILAVVWVELYLWWWIKEALSSSEVEV